MKLSSLHDVILESKYTTFYLDLDETLIKEVPQEDWEEYGILVDEAGNIKHPNGLSSYLLRPKKDKPSVIVARNGLIRFLERLSSITHDKIVVYSYSPHFDVIPSLIGIDNYVDGFVTTPMVPRKMLREPEAHPHSLLIDNDPGHLKQVMGGKLYNMGLQFYNLIRVKSFDGIAVDNELLGVTLGRIQNRISARFPDGD